MRSDHASVALACALMLASTGCQLNVNDIPVMPRTSGARDAGSKATDASANGASANDSATQTPKHASCNAPAPTPMPFAGVASDAHGRPMFDTFRDYDCNSDAVRDYPTCEAYDGDMPWACDACFGEPQLEKALCTKADAPGCITLAFSAGACFECVPPEAKAKACCSGSTDFDCRAWPFARVSGPNENCARHADCEPGLVCTPFDTTRGRGFARCLCPELTAEPSLEACVTYRNAR